jgi:hypothetical protein
MLCLHVRLGLQLELCSEKAATCFTRLPAVAAVDGETARHLPDADDSWATQVLLLLLLLLLLPAEVVDRRAQEPLRQGGLKHCFGVTPCSVHPCHMLRAAACMGHSLLVGG